MKKITLFRSASVLLVLHFLGHTLGGMLSRKSLGPASDAVFAEMQRVHFVFNGADCTWYGFWFGFGLVCSLFLLLSAIVAWELDRVTPEVWPLVQGVAWALVVAQALSTVLAWSYFFAGPGLFGIAITLLLAAGTLRKSRAAVHDAAGRDALV